MAKRQPYPVPTQREAELLARMNLGLSETEAWRFQQLDSLREQERLTPQGLMEFLALADASERLRNDRLEAAVELAGLRGVSVSLLLSELGLGPTSG